MAIKCEGCGQLIFPKTPTVRVSVGHYTLNREKPGVEVIEFVPEVDMDAYCHGDIDCLHKLSVRFKTMMASLRSGPIILSSGVETTVPLLDMFPREESKDGDN